ncbi:hypothetical protein RM572_01205 [Streptomyces sp. DSM 42041]|uniref:Lipoprotein n=1 Tax=Streptomyces hazeniae TaxID=3075538 RepID=A0ABU2NL94_9ACTN|nr:hypothetical protein [Streptomyces sp. DSM 42041]MDT0377391.1 hypothetical protein [Streptomyces sp. DSM 42041]
MTGARSAAAPLRTLLMLASFAVTAYAGLRLLEGGPVVGILIWFVGAALLHDMVLLPLYGVADRALQGVLVRRRPGAPPSPVVNHVRVPAFVSGVLLLVWYPLILGLSDNYRRYSTLDPDVFRGRWLLLTAGLFAASALLYVARMLLASWPREDRDAGAE